VSALGRSLHVIYVLAIVTAIVMPNLPRDLFGPVPGTLAGWLREVSLVQSWRMYAPHPQLAQVYMNLTAVYDDGTERELEETYDERDGWSTHWAWDKTRIDIWRHYANFTPTKANPNRTWYLKGVCVREARGGEIPNKIVMHQVRRRFTPPSRVQKGQDPLGTRGRRLITVQPCKTKQLLQMIEADRDRLGAARG
jgi:hypothetical protein